MQQHADLVLHPHHLPDRLVELAQCAPPFANRGRRHAALRQKIAPQTLTNLAGVDGIILFFQGGNGLQHQGMCCAAAPGRGCSGEIP